MKNVNRAKQLFKLALLGDKKALAKIESCIESIWTTIPYKIKLRQSKVGRYDVHVRESDQWIGGVVKEGVKSWWYWLAFKDKHGSYKTRQEAADALWEAYRQENKDG